MPFVYVLSNEAMPGLVKIGMTDDTSTNARIGQLYTSGVPYPFDLEYACEVPNALSVERALHTAFAPHRVNPRREFFRIEPEQAIAILRLLDRATDVTANVASQPSDVDSESLAAVRAAKKRRPNLNFEEMGIPAGSILTAADDPSIQITVADGRRVKISEDDVTSLTNATAVLLARPGTRPVIYWTFQGRLLSDIYEETYSHFD